MPRVPPDTTPQAPPTTPETPEAISLRRRADIAKHSLSREELQEFLADTLDPLSAEERNWLGAYIENAGDWRAMADSAGISERAVRNIIARPRLRRALGQCVGNLASPEMIVAGLVDQAFGSDKVSSYWESGAPQRIDHKLRQDALLALAKLRGLLVDRLDVRGVDNSDEALNRLIESEMRRVQGRLPGSGEVVDAVAVTTTQADDAAPSTDAAGEAPSKSDLVD